MPSILSPTLLARSVLVSMLAIASPGCGGPGLTPVASDPPPSLVAPTDSASANGSPSAASTTRVTITGFAFGPSQVSVALGTTVIWTNEEDALHTVVSGAPDEDPGARFASGELDTGDSFRFTFEAPGRYAFFCDRHPFMRGEVVVSG